MKLSFRSEWIRKIKGNKKFDAILEVLQTTGDRYVTVDLTQYSEVEVGDIRKVLIELGKLGDDKTANYQVKHEAGDAKEALTKLNGYRRFLKEGASTPVPNLRALVDALKMHLGKLPRHWIFREGADGQMLPFFVSNVEYIPGRRQYEASHVRMTLEASLRGKDAKTFIAWYDYHLMADANVLTEDEGFDEDDLESYEGGEVEVGGDALNIKKKAAHLSVQEILLRKQCYPENEDLVESYMKNITDYKVHIHSLGKVLVAGGRAIEAGSDWWARDKAVEMVREGQSTKVVLDNTYVEEQKDRGYGYSSRESKTAVGPLVDNAFWKSGVVPRPIHTYFQVFDLEKHNFVEIHVNNITPYKYDTDLKSKLVLDEDTKTLLEMLIENSADLMDDIIKGKTGGTIVIATGPPGVGKTLSAEVYSEVMQRPLYAVQCSQLGTNEENLEKNLRRVLTLAGRWGAVLLMDEADVYIRERGEDIHQNAIVGVFLRLLEYYKGVLFMTSNRGMIIDDAILSRASAWIKYEMPCIEDVAKIWKVLSTQFGMVLPDDLMADLLKEFPVISGRSIKNLLKLAKMLASRKHRTVNIKMFRWISKFQDISTK